nr:MAG TPA: hypothetical protein [Caudoviricetes sp.]
MSSRLVGVCCSCCAARAFLILKLSVLNSNERATLEDLSSGVALFIALVYLKVYTIVATFSRRFINNGGYTTEMG